MPRPLTVPLRFSTVLVLADGSVRLPVTIALWSLTRTVTLSPDFAPAVVATGVLGVQWKLGDTLFLSLEGQGRYFIQTKEYNFGGAVRIGWSF